MLSGKLIPATEKLSIAISEKRRLKLSFRAMA